LTVAVFLSRFYYCLFIMDLTTIAALAISLIRYNRHRQLRIFTYYILLSLLQDAVSVPMHFPSEHKQLLLTIFETFTNLFVVAEYIIFIYFVLNAVASVKKRWVIKANGAVFFAILLLVWYRTPRFTYSPAIFSLESIFLVPPCLLYFHELFMEIRMEPLKDQPAFWVITGILFLNACSIPLFLSVSMIDKYFKVAFTLNYILYTTFFLLLIRAYLCKSSSPALAGAVQG
jgi:hypothetical protein